MAIHFSNSTGQLFKKSIDEPVAQVSYHLIETDATQYTKKKWWGDFQSNKQLNDFQSSGTLRLEFDDGRSGECIVMIGNEADSSKKTGNHIYHFNGRGKLSRGNNG